MIRNVFNHKLSNKYSFTFYLQSTSTKKLLKSKEPITNSFPVVLGFKELAFWSPWRWCTCIETWWRHSFNVCTY